MKSKEKDGVVELSTTLPFRYKLGIFFLAVALLAAIGLVFCETKLKIKEVNVSGNTWYSSEEITNQLQTEYLDKYSLFFKIHYIFGEMPEIPFVDKITIKFDSLDTINITVYEKNIVGCVLEMGEYLYFDKDGYIISSRSERMNNIPEITGLDYRSLTIGKQLEVEDTGVFSRILSMTQLIDKYEILIDSIHFDDELNVTLNCTDRNVVYLGGRSNYNDVMMALPNILAAAEEKTAKYKIDMSSFSEDNTVIKAEFIEQESPEAGDAGDGEGDIDPEAGDGEDSGNPDDGEGEDDDETFAG